MKKNINAHSTQNKTKVGVSGFFAQDCWSAYILFNQIHYFMVKINTFFAEWWSGPTSADRQGQNTGVSGGPFVLQITTKSNGVHNLLFYGHHCTLMSPSGHLKTPFK
jgi:hypothetical protein